MTSIREILENEIAQGRANIYAFRHAFDSRTSDEIDEFYCDSSAADIVHIGIIVGFDFPKPWNDQNFDAEELIETATGDPGEADNSFSLRNVFPWFAG